MKKIVLIIVLALIAFTQSITAEEPMCVIQVKLVNPDGTNNFDYVDESHLYSNSVWYHHLRCQYPGEVPCVFEDGDPCGNVLHRTIPYGAVKDEDGNPILWVDIDMLNDKIQDSMEQGINSKRFIIEGEETVFMSYRYDEDTNEMIVKIIVGFEV